MTGTDPAGAERSRSNLVWTEVRGVRVQVRPTPDELAEEIRRQFFKAGMAYTLLTKRDISAASWISAARKVAHLLGRPVHTAQDGPEVRAWLKDWPRDEREAEIHRQRQARHAALQYGIKPDQISGTNAANQADASSLTVRSIFVAGSMHDQRATLVAALERMRPGRYRVAAADADPTCFDRDVAAIRAADDVVMLVPGGAAAHLAVGIAYGLGKRCFVLGDEQAVAPYTAFALTAATAEDLIVRLAPH